MSWSLFQEEEDELEGSRQYHPGQPLLLPMALREIWNDNESIPIPQAQSLAQRNAQRQAIIHGPSSYNSFNNPTSAIAGSAPVPTNSINPHLNPAFNNASNLFSPNDITFQGVIELDGASQSNKSYFQVQFNQFHIDLYQANKNVQLTVGDYVLTEADRGYDIGRIIQLVQRPPTREAQNSKKIIRIATQHEVAQLPQKASREARALQIGRAKVAEFMLPMSLTAAEFQFDGNKLTFYYQASSYIDFRNLVKALFRIFQIRIWMQASGQPVPMPM
ncbi:hypothetical protein TRFO_06154 [Tritrichomonas foetus]|uniref:PSP1 C-terminal domain-containing protein n=1 Tax=Tritrichomonas foetus TaxID=1144522 RepID=A0A1J4JZY2_9EUKA|nr:hypothetical protein TRFO_06154 [Tritrichomonas foetus]|eukprot:OHT04727.1 hypothetical protein TRFO_06154 [Tritrichomonas foetus]